MSQNKRLALVTGASSGIGAEICRHLKTESDLEIWLIARRRERLDALAEELRSQGAMVKSICIDLQKEESWADLESQVKASGLRVGWLINNAGFGYSGRFEHESLESIEGMIQLNVKALSSLSRRMIPLMEKGSHIVNIASAIAFLPVAGHALYAATKAFVLSFSLALREELKPRGISVSAVCPGPVATEFWDAAGVGAPPKIIVEDASNTAFLSVEKSAQGKAIILTGFAAWVARIMAALLPRTWIASLSRRRIER
jgi:uncharacterized protein